MAAYMDRPLLPENFHASEATDWQGGRSLDDWVTFHQAGTRLVEYLNHTGQNGLMLSVMADGSVSRLDGLLLHYTYETMEQYIDKLNRYTTLAAEELHAAGHSAILPSAVVRAKVAFLRMWLFKGGILDGWAGTVLSLASGFYVLSKYTKLWRMGRR